MIRVVVVFISLLVAMIVIAADPPKLVTTSPGLWAIGIIPATHKTIKLSFDQPMVPGFTAWLGRSSLAPEVDLNSSVSNDRKTFELKVTLQPGKVYVFALNERGLPGVGFQNDKGISLPPTFLVFQTAGKPAPQDAPPALQRASPTEGSSIDPAKVSSIMLVFDQPMNVKKHGLRLTENGAAVDVSRSQFSYSPDGRTFTLGHQFKPAARYRLELNSNQNIGFTSANRVPLWPLQINFATSVPR